MKRPAREREMADVAAITERMAVLLEAGVSPGAGWAHLAEFSAHPQVAAAAAAAADGDNIAAAVFDAADSEAAGGRAWRAFAAAWFVATEAGAPLAECLRHLARSYRDLARTQSELSIALAGPAATARLVGALPVIGIAFGLVLGFDTLRVLLTTGIGWACVAAGAVLMLLAWGWDRALIRRATPRDPAPGLSFDLLAVAVRGGGSLEGGKALVARALDLFGLPDLDGPAVERTVALSRRAGAPVAELLRAQAEQARRQARADGQVAAAKLAVRLMLPLAACVLPAFMLWAVVPLLATILSSTLMRF